VAKKELPRQPAQILPATKFLAMIKNKRPNLAYKNSDVQNLSSCQLKYQTREIAFSTLETKVFLPKPIA